LRDKKTIVFLPRNINYQLMIILKFNFNNKEKIVTAILCLIAIGLVIFYINALSIAKKFKDAPANPPAATTSLPSETVNEPASSTLSPKNTECETAKNYLVTGMSLSGLIEPGETVKIIKDYYNCHTVQRDDIVAYNYAGRTNFIIKIVKAIPNDVWKLQNTGKGNLIIVNGQSLKNSKGQEYVIPDEKSAMLALYVKDYPKIPDKTYLLLGNDPQGTLDSTRFGLVGLQDIVGKVVKQ